MMKCVFFITWALLYVCNPSLDLTPPPCFFRWVVAGPVLLLCAPWMADAHQKTTAVLLRNAVRSSHTSTYTTSCCCLFFITYMYTRVCWTGTTALPVQYLSNTHVLQRYFVRYQRTTSDFCFPV